MLHNLLLLTVRRPIYGRDVEGVEKGDLRSQVKETELCLVGSWGTSEGSGVRRTF